ncbi:MAG: glutamine--fructose-6-phosphate transaminase (isomerizing) [Deltaproteobacteria bacterium]|nr:glutamine--fructose-6-phosphate transaminase (isomerizing) [Deltaproteobacteria bacterium]
MCGIVGYVGDKNATEILLDGLRRLEYRGYDSAGVALLDKDQVTIVRSEGKLSALKQKLSKKKMPQGVIGIGHTRWATHGRPSETNAHPHRAGPIILVHNGIIENHVKLRAYLSKKGHTIRSETDTELVCHLIQQRMYDGMKMADAFHKVLNEIEGSYALVVLNQKEPDRLYIARRGSPLVVGLGYNGHAENFVASDVAAVLSHTKSVLFLEDGDRGIVTRRGVQLWDQKIKPVIRPKRLITWSQSMAEKGGYKHFMLKEIFEQPRSLTDTLSGRISENRRRVLLNGAEKLFQKKGKFPFERIYIVACGTSYHAGLVGKYLIEEMSRLPVMVDQASEFRYRNPIIDKKTLIISISQSGETADTLAAITEAKKKGAKLLSICNVIDSSIARVSHETLYTHAGPEIGVASTKAFTTQLILMILIALYLGKVRNQITDDFMKEALEAIVRVPEQMEKVLKLSHEVSSLARKYADVADFLYFGRGVNYPIALEGALKLKEISYIHAEGYPAGEMKHGPIALIESGLPIIVLAPQDKTYNKVLSNIEEVRARGAHVIGIGFPGDKALAGRCHDLMTIPKSPWYISPLLLTIPLQLLAYYIADHKGTDVDQPRNLAKSVTVE